MDPVEVKKAVEIETPEGHQAALVQLWKDGHVTVCITPELEGDVDLAICRTSKKPEGEKLYYMAQWWFCEMIPGARVKKLEGEE